MHGAGHIDKPGTRSGIDPGSRRAIASALALSSRRITTITSSGWRSCNSRPGEAAQQMIAAAVTTDQDTDAAGRGKRSSRLLCPINGRQPKQDRLGSSPGRGSRMPRTARKVPSTQASRAQPPSSDPPAAPTSPKRGISNSMAISEQATPTTSMAVTAPGRPVPLKDCDRVRGRAGHHCFREQDEKRRDGRRKACAVTEDQKRRTCDADHHGSTHIHNERNPGRAAYRLDDAFGLPSRNRWK